MKTTLVLRDGFMRKTAVLWILFELPLPNRHHLPANFGNLNNFFSDIKFQDLKGLIYYFLSGGPFDLRGGPFVG